MKEEKKIKALKLTSLIMIFPIVISGIITFIIASGNIVGIVETSSSVIGWFSIMATIFASAITGLAIYVAFIQTNKIHEENKEYTRKEKIYEKQLNNLDFIKNATIGIISETFSLNIVKKVNVKPISEEEVRGRKDEIYRLYSFAEKNFAQMFISGVLYQYISLDGAESEVSRDDLEEKGRKLAEKYRELYNSFQDYINFKINSLDVLYRINDLWIWELDTKHLEENEIKATFDENKPWIRRYGKRVNIEVNHDGIPFVDEITYKTDLQSSLNDKIMKAYLEEDQFITKLNEIAFDVRTYLAHFCTAFEEYELLLLQGKLSGSKHPNKSKQLYAFLAERQKNK